MVGTPGSAHVAADHETTLTIPDCLSRAADLLARHQALADTDPAGARAALNESLALRRWLHLGDPTNPFIQRALVVGLTAAAREREGAGGAGSAAPLYREALDLLRSVLAASLRDSWALSEKYHCTAALLAIEASLGHGPECERLLRELLEIVDQAIEVEPGAARWHRRRAAALLKSGTCLAQPLDAAHRFDAEVRAAASARRAMELDPGDLASKAWFAQAMAASGETEAELGRAIGGSARVRVAVDTWRQLANVPQPPPGALDRLLDALVTLGELQFGQGLYDAATRWLAEALALAESRQYVGHSSSTGTLATIHLAMSRVAFSNGDERAAGHHAYRSVRLSSALVEESPGVASLWQLSTACEMDALVSLQARRLAAARRTWDRAISAARQAAALTPGVAGSAARLGRALMSRAEFEAQQGYGATALAAFAEAAEAYRRAVSLDGSAAEWRWALVQVLCTLESMAARRNEHDVATRAALEAQAAASAAVAAASETPGDGVVERFVARSPGAAVAVDDSGTDGSPASWALGSLPAERGPPAISASTGADASRQIWLEQHAVRLDEVREEAEDGRRLERARRNLETRRVRELDRRAEEDRQAGVTRRILAARTEWRAEEDGRHAAELAHIEEDFARHRARVAENELAWMNYLSEWGAADELERDEADVAAGRRLRSRLPTC